MRKKKKSSRGRTCDHILTLTQSQSLHDASDQQIHVTTTCDTHTHTHTQSCTYTLVMSDLWSFSSSSPPPILHQSAPPLSSPSSLRNHGAPHVLPPPPYVTSPQHLPPQHLLSSPHQDPGLINLTWRDPELCSFDSVFYQTTAHLDLQNHTSPGVTQQQDTHRFSYNAVCGHGDTPGPGQGPWGPLETPLPQTQCPPVGSMSGGVGLGGWSSAAPGDLPNTHFFPDGYHDAYHDSYQDSYHDGYVPHVFCSPTTPGPTTPGPSPHYPPAQTFCSPTTPGPTTPGPSPHYPPAQTFCSPAPQIHPLSETLGFHRETLTQLISDPTFHRCPLTPEARQHLLHQTSRPLLLNQSDLIQDQTDVFDPSFSPQAGGQNVSAAAQGPSLAAGLMWSDKPGGGGGGAGGGGGGAGGGGGGGGGGGRGRGRGGRGRGRGGGGEAQPQWTWMKSSQPENNTKVLDNRLLCTVCKRDFRSLPALNGHMRSHSCLKKAEVPPVPVVMPVSVPVGSRGGASKACRGGQKRCSRPSPATGGTVLYRSLMHLEEQEVVTRGSAAAREVEGHYTPLPMLCPIRAGPGLFCSVTTRRQRRAQTVQLHSSDNGLIDLVAMETPTTETNKPRINVGRGFQAEIPPLLNHKHAHSDSQNALWLWTPCDELEKPVNQHRVTTLLTMARSSVVPGGGASPEYALHVLSQSAGDFLLTLEKLLATPESSDRSHAGVAWSAAETTSLVKSLRLHRKDFSRVQKAVQTKSVPQCVEFYYLWKKKLSLRARPPAGLTVTLPQTNVVRSSSDDFDPERPSASDKRS